MSRYLIVSLISVGTILFFSGFVYNDSHVTAAELAPQVQTTPNPQLSIRDDVCLGCHGQQGLTLDLENGDTLELYVNPEDHQNSVHGRLGYACVQCHRSVGDYPHPPFTAQDRRRVAIQLYEACKVCHIAEYNLAQDSVHGYALSQQIYEAAICTDCHTAHAVRQINDASGNMLPEVKTWIPTTCAQCHNSIYQKYLGSVHGSALVETGNTDVPTCIDCHGVHNIEDPTTEQFRLKSPEICAKCHTDPNMMIKYGLSTDVLNTYVSDFHGTTVTLFEKLTPDAKTNAPVCYDCHGIHDIKRVDDPQVGIHLKQNLLVRCQECHPDATTNFPDSWLSHYIPSAENASAVYYVNLFYKIFIPLLLGGMLILVLLDLGSQARKWYRKTYQVKGSEVAMNPTQNGLNNTEFITLRAEDKDNPKNIGNEEE